ncbi:MAG TPA: papain-like cysteine protease family protein [Telluria sp.]|nr:papain-like cysteine protease family protein [Telluria sp.]
MSSQTIIFSNSMTSPTSLVTFKLIGANSPAQPLAYTLTTGSTVAPDIGALAGPWTVWANVGDAVSPESYDTAFSTILALPATVDIAPQPVGMLGISELWPGLPSPDADSGKGYGAGQEVRPKSIFSRAGADLNATLAFTMTAQTQTNWCWCTVAACVAKFYVPQTLNTPCALAIWKFGSCGDCCKLAPPAGCNMPESVMNALTYVGNLNAGTVGPLNFDAIKTEIDGGRAVVVNIEWTGTSLRHSIAVTGYNVSASGNTITLQDPADASTTTMPYSTFPAKYKTGASWYTSYTTKP